MSTTKQLATGLGGAVGSDYRSSPHQLYFVEFNGNLSRIDLIQPLDHVVFSGIATMPADSSLNLMNGTSAQGGHIRWDHTDPSGGRVMRPQGNCQLANLGMVDYNAITHAELQDLNYSQASIHGDVGPNNQVNTNDVFAVLNTSVQPAANFEYAKVQVVSYGANIQVRWTTYKLKPRYQVLGTGYNQPEDIKITSDEAHAYVTERTGNLLRVTLANANRVNATVVSSGMTAPQQMFLDEPHNRAYVVEFADPGRLFRIDLSTGVKTTLISTLHNAVGVLLSADLQFAYVTEQSGPGAGTLSRINLSNSVREVLVTGLTAPFMLSWSDPGESGILIPERDPANRITRANLAVAPVTTAAIATAVSVRPSSVQVVSSDRLVVCANTEVDLINLSSSVFVATGPMLLGVGHVPVSRISRHNPVDPNVDGYADTTVDPSYFFQVKDSPFGGTLPIMFNHDNAFLIGARYYRLFVDGSEPLETLTDYLWSTPANSFVAQNISPTAVSYYPVRSPAQLWYNHWLAYLLYTGALSNGVHTIGVKLFSATVPAAEIGTINDPGRTMVVRIDNGLPQASIDVIRHDGGVVGTCGIVSSGSDAFTFDIVALDAEQHLLSWSLSALWGDNKSKAVDSDSYSNHVAVNKKWAGISATVPVVAPSPWHATVAGDPTSTRCAHTFYLGVWDRVIDGWNYIHYSDYHKSITIMLP